MTHVYLICALGVIAGSFYVGARYGRRMERVALDDLAIGYTVAKTRYDNLVKAWTTKA